ncbi:hypothetical protein KHO49_17315 [Pseudomonas sp. RC4D1]|uniref:hypothetical protein n=1 Tax=Pseudomonas sp. RC4D1 TaxID=2834407 RepID=UPI001BCB5AC0|nr:hypothetical protein [Pseudomonas sp. RC4D1]MBS7560101.1 hypothetical protein [Pseudomonas sp. RC4D1]
MQNLYRTVAISIPFALVFSSYASASFTISSTPPQVYSGSATSTISVAQTIQNPVNLTARYIPGLAISAAELTEGKIMGTIELDVDSGSISAVKITTVNDYKLLNAESSQKIDYCIADQDGSNSQQICSNDNAVAIFEGEVTGRHSGLNIIASANAAPYLSSGEFNDTLTVVVYTQ